MTAIYGELKVAQLECLTSDPASTVDGRVYFHTTDNICKYYNGAAWRTFIDDASTQSITGVKTFTSPVINTGISGTAIADEDDMVSDSATKVPTQQSVKAYVDTELAAITGASDSSQDYLNGSLATSVAASALTIALKDADGNNASAGSPVSISFRSATATTGTYTVRTVTASLSVTVSSGSTLGHASGHDDYIYVYAIDNAGTVELAVSSTVYDDGSIVTTTAEGGAGAADSLTDIYSTTARTGVALRLIGRLKSNQATAGTWATAIAEISNVPFSNHESYPPSMTDVIATKLGFKAYAHGTNYRASIAPTITATTSVSSVAYSAFIPYQMQDGSWRMRFTFKVTLSGSTTANTYTVNGVTFKNASGARQFVGGVDLPDPNTPCFGSAIQNTSTIFLASNSADEFSLSGDVALESKPTWAY